MLFTHYWYFVVGVAMSYSRHKTNVLCKCYFNQLTSTLRSLLLAFCWVKLLLVCDLD